MKYLSENLALCLGVLCVVLSCAAPARAATKRADGEEDQKPSVVLSPHFQVFADMEGMQDGAAASRAFYQGAATYAANHPDLVYLVTQSDLVHAVKTARGFDWRLENAQLATELGIDNYKKLAVDKATTHLESALKTYRELHYGLAEPERVAEVALYLALSNIERDDTTLALFDRLQTMILLDPSRHIRPGYYPDDVVRLYRSARESLIRLLREEGPEKRGAQELASFADTDYVIYGYAWPTDRGTHQVALYVYSRKDERFLRRESVEVDSLDAKTLRQAGNRLMARFLPCFDRRAPSTVSTMVDSDGESPFSLQFGFAYASFLQFPFDERQRTEPWGNYGLSVTGRLLLTRDFGLVVGGHILNSMRDYGGFLFDDFSTLRAFAGGDMGVQLGDFNVGLQLTLEATTLGNFRACPDVDALCAERAEGAHTVRMDGFDLFMGINARPRVFWQAYRQFSLVGSVSASYYFIPLSGREFNFPVTGEMGVSYRF